MVHRLDFDLGLHRLATAADGGGSRDYPDRLAIAGLGRGPRNREGTHMELMDGIEIEEGKRKEGS